jgi:CheY-like chemotaxis protein
MSDSSQSILLAEDDPDDVFLMQRAFTKARLPNPLHVVADGEEAICYLSGDGPYSDRHRFPIPMLMLLDLKLPRRNGLEVLGWIRRQSCALRRLPVVVLTSSKQAVDVNCAYELGANSYFVKPVTFEGLQQLVTTLQLYWLTMSQKPDVQLDPALHV